MQHYPEGCRPCVHEQAAEQRICNTRGVGIHDMMAAVAMVLYCSETKPAGRAAASNAARA